VRQVRLAMIGFGAVGRELVRMIVEENETLTARSGIELHVWAIADSSGAVFVPQQAALGAILDHKLAGKGLGTFVGAYRSWTMEDFLSQADVLVELGPTDLTTGQPSLDRIRWALALRRHVITGNKGPLALDYTGLMKLAESAGMKLKFSAAVLGGLPILNMAKGFDGSQITGFEGVLGATPNHILSRMESDGLDYQAALNLTKALGIAERDPRLDVEGWDTAAKTVILANALLGANLTLAQVQVKGITDVTPLDLIMARRQGGALKLVGWAKKQGDRVYAQVEPRVMPPDHPLAHVSGAAQAITVETDHMGRVTLAGGASNPRVAAASVLRDLIHLAQEVSEPIAKGAGPAGGLIHLED